MAALAGACPAAAGWMGRRLRTTMLRDVVPVTTAPVLPRARARRSALWAAAAPSRSITISALHGSIPHRTLLCPGCDLAARRWYSSSSSSDKPPKNDDSQPTIIFAPPPPEGSVPTSPPPLPKTGTAETSADPKPDEPIQQTEEVKTKETGTEKTDGPASSSTKPDSDTSSLPSFVESRRSALNARFSRFMDDLQARFVSASQTLSDLTGYTAIEHIKAHNAKLETDLATAQADLRVARRSYQAVNERRAATQREVTTLLARKDSWAPPDLERFTVLYRQDHELETSAQKAVEQLKEAEADEARLSAAVTSGILKRYHEEQVWSDRIRRQSTWGTWGLMGLNVVLFIILQVIAEPWRRRRLMRGIAEAESGVLEDVRKELADVRAALATVSNGAPAAAETKPTETAEQVAAAPVEAADVPVAVEVPPTEEPALAPPVDSLPYPPLRLQLFSLSWPISWQDVVAFGPDPVRWKAWANDIVSERTVNVRMRDVSIVAMQSAIAGAVFVGGLMLALR